MPSHVENFWYPYIVKALHAYPDKLTDSVQGCIARNAIRRTIEETEQIIDGSDRVKLEMMVNIKQTHTLDGAAYVLHISRRTAQRWNQKFIYTCAERMGFI